jgi:hypothetical protein
MADADVTVTHGTDGHARQDDGMGAPEPANQSLPGKPQMSPSARERWLKAVHGPKKRAKSPAGRIAEFSELISRERARTTTDDTSKLGLLMLCDENLAVLKRLLTQIASDASGKTLDRFAACSARIQRALGKMQPRSQAKQKKTLRTNPAMEHYEGANGEKLWRWRNLPSHVAHPEQVHYEDDCQIIGEGDPSNAIDAEIV